MRGGLQTPGDPPTGGLQTPVDLLGVGEGEDVGKQQSGLKSSLSTLMSQ